MNTSRDVITPGDGEKSPYTGLASCVIPEAETPYRGECSHTGVSTRYAPTALPASQLHYQWYALRTTYGRERKAYDYIVEHGGIAFLPTVTCEKVVKGKKQLVEVSRIPNIFFAYGTEKTIRAFVYDNYNLPFLRFYYRHTHVLGHIEKTPMIVPDDQIRSLQIICGVDSSVDVLVVPEKIEKFKAGQRVQVVEGMFQGVEGVVARYQGQQRVGIIVDGLLTALTAYVPTAFLVKI